MNDEQKAARRFTDAQKRALAWLPSDGSWARKPGSFASAVDSLHLYFRDLVDIECGYFGPRGGWERRMRLTEKGVAVKAARTARGDL